MKFIVYVYCNILDDMCYILMFCFCIKLYKRIKFILMKIYFSLVLFLYNDIWFWYLVIGFIWNILRYFMDKFIKNVF